MKKLQLEERIRAIRTNHDRIKPVATKTQRQTCIDSANRMKPTEIEATEINTTEISATEINTTEIEATEIEATEKSH